MHKGYLVNEVLARVVQGEEEDVERKQYKEVFVWSL